MVKLRITDLETGVVHEDIVLGVVTEDCLQVINWDGNTRFIPWPELPKFRIEIVGFEQELF